MSVRVVQTDPLTINRTKVLLTDIEHAKKQEWDRRRKLRLQQVRQQSRDLAVKMRKRVLTELKTIEKMEETENIKKKEWKDKQLKHLKHEFDKCLESVGSGHQSAALQPDPKLILKEQKDVMQAVARARGALAEEKAKLEKNHVKDKENKAVQQLKLTRQVEKLRSAMVSNLPPAIERFKKQEKPKSPKKKNLKATKDVCTSPVVSPKKVLQSHKHKATSPIKFQTRRMRNRSLTMSDDESDAASDDSSVTWPPRSQNKKIHTVKLYDHNVRKASEYIKPTSSVTRIQDEFDMRIEIDKEEKERVEYEKLNKHKINEMNKRGKQALHKEQTKREFDQICSAVSELDKQNKINQVSGPPPDFKHQERLEKLLKELQESPEKNSKVPNKNPDGLKHLCNRFQKQREKLLHPNDIRNLKNDSSDDEIDVAGWFDIVQPPKVTEKPPKVTEKPPLAKKQVKNKSPEQKNMGKVLPHYDPRPGNLEERKNQKMTLKNISYEENQPSFTSESEDTLKQAYPDNRILADVIHHKQRSPCNQDSQRSPCNQDSQRSPCNQDSQRSPCNQDSERSQTSTKRSVTRRSLPEEINHTHKRSVRNSWPLEKSKTPVSENHESSFLSTETLSTESYATPKNVFREHLPSISSSESGSDALQVVVRVKGKKTEKMPKIQIKNVDTSSTSYMSPPDNLSPEHHSILSSVLKKLVVKNKNPRLHDYIIELLNKSKSSLEEMGVSSISDISIPSNLCDNTSAKSSQKLNETSENCLETTNISSVNETQRSDMVDALVKRIEHLTDIVDGCNVIFSRSPNSLKDDSLSFMALPKQGQDEFIRRYPVPEDSVRSGGHYFNESSGSSIGIPGTIQPKPFQNEPQPSTSATPISHVRKAVKGFNLSTIQEVDTPYTLKSTKKKTLSEKSESSQASTDLSKRLRTLQDFYRNQNEPHFENSVSSISDSELLTDKDVCSLLESSDDDGIEQVFKSLGIGWALSTLRKTRERNKLSTESTSSNGNERASKSRSKSSSIRHSTPIKNKKSPEKNYKKNPNDQDSLTPPSISLCHPFLK